jgi:hypothetical protein
MTRESGVRSVGGVRRGIEWRYRKRQRRGRERRMAGLLSGAIAGPLLVGVLAEHEPLALASGACAALALLAACTVLAVREAAVPRRA